MTNNPSITILRGHYNLEEWKLKVIQYFASYGMGDHLCSSTTRPDADIFRKQKALGLTVLVTSLSDD
jgi:hypothetical protein